MSSEEKGAPINEGHFKCRWLQVFLRQDFSLFTAVLWIRIRIKFKGSIRIPDQQQSDKQDSDPHQIDKLDPDPHNFSENKPKCMEYEPI